VLEAAQAVTHFLTSVRLVAMHRTWLNLLGISVQVRGGPPVFTSDEAGVEVIIGTDGLRARHDIGIPSHGAGCQSILVPGGDQAAIRIRLPSSRRGFSGSRR
jgi:hypothetical protein